MPSMASSIRRDNSSRYLFTWSTSSLDSIPMKTGSGSRFSPPLGGATLDSEARSFDSDAGFSLIHSLQPSGPAF